MTKLDSYLETLQESKYYEVGGAAGEQYDKNLRACIKAKCSNAKFGSAEKKKCKLTCKLAALNKLFSTMASAGPRACKVNKNPERCLKAFKVDQDSIKKDILKTKMKLAKS